MFLAASLGVVQKQIGVNHHWVENIVEFMGNPGSHCVERVHLL
jgi:hypothetical protein